MSHRDSVLAYRDIVVEEREQRQRLTGMLRSGEARDDNPAYREVCDRYRELSSLSNDLNDRLKRRLVGAFFAMMKHGGRDR